MVLCATGLVGACGSDEKKPAPVEAGAQCGNGTKEGTEECDTTVPSGTTCATATKNARPNGTVTKCLATCKFDTSGCTSTGSGGAGGTAGAGGTSGAGGGGTTDGGMDASSDGAATGGTGGTTATDAAADGDAAG